MKTKTLLATLIMSLLVSGCIPSLKPFYTSKDVVTDSRIIGLWTEKDESEKTATWNFETNKDNAYTLTICDKDDKTGKFTAHLFKIDAELFLDIIPSECNFATNQLDMIGMSVFPGHLVAHVSQIEPKLHISFFDFKWLEDFLKEKPEEIAYHKEDDRYILTASTLDLQRFITKNLKNGLFDKPTELSRTVKSK
jgi:hypothetical protein